MSEYPRMVYGPDGQSKIVASEQDENGLPGEWSREPDNSHFSRFSEHHTTRVPVDGPDQNQNRGQQVDEEALTARIMQRLADQGLLRRPPGRPPGSANRPSDDGE